MRLQQIRKVAFMFRGKMNNYYKRQTAVRRPWSKNFLSAESPPPAEAPMPTTVGPGFDDLG